MSPARPPERIYTHPHPPAPSAPHEASTDSPGPAALGEMTRHRKNPQNPQKMQDFFKAREHQQNGAGTSGRQTENQATINNNGRSGPAKQLQGSHLTSGSSSGASSPSTRSPAKQKQRIASPDSPLRDPEMEVSRPSEYCGSSRAYHTGPYSSIPHI